MADLTEQSINVSATAGILDAGVLGEVVIERAVLMDKYFTERDLSTISPTPFFKIASVEWGYGFIEQVGGKDSVAEIPTNSTGLDSVLHENVPDMTYVNNIISLRCVMPAGVVPDGSSESISAINIKDAKGNSLAITAVLPIPVTKDRLLQFDLEIKVTAGGA